MAKKKIEMQMPESHSVRVEKIDNGFLAHHTHSDKKGFQSKTVYHPSKPKLIVPTIEKSKKGK
jgi:hypothetical protein